jgi:tartrate-resistant acid phosphatase type 5
MNTAHKRALGALTLAVTTLAGPAALAQSVTFGVIGDYGDDDDDTRAVAAMMLGWDLEFIATVGDNDYSDGASRGTFDALELGVGQYFHTFIGDYKGSYGPGASQNRFFPIPGDHDWGDTCDDPAGLDDYLAYFTLPESKPGNERYYDVRRGPVHLFMIHALEDCEPDGADADSVQAAWVKETAAKSDAPFKVALVHVPPWSSGTHGEDGEHMRWPWKDWGFQLVIGGNDHDYERIFHEGITSVVNGLGGVDARGFGAPVAGSLVRFTDEYGAMWVEATESLMTLAFVTVRGEVVDAFTVAPDGTTTATTLADPPAGAPQELVDAAESGDDDGGGCAGGGGGAAWMWALLLIAVAFRLRAGAARVACRATAGRHPDVSAHTRD